MISIAQACICNIRKHSGFAHHHKLNVTQNAVPTQKSSRKLKVDCRKTGKRAVQSWLARHWTKQILQRSI